MNEGSSGPKWYAYNTPQNILSEFRVETSRKKCEKNEKKQKKEKNRTRKK